jgi:hypothetical protein
MQWAAAVLAGHACAGVDGEPPSQRRQFVLKAVTGLHRTAPQQSHCFLPPGHCVPLASRTQ